MRFRFKRVCSSAWLERTPDKGEVGGSSPPRPTNSQRNVLSKEAYKNKGWASFSNRIAYLDKSLTPAQLIKNIWGVSGKFGKLKN